MCKGFTENNACMLSSTTLCHYMSLTVSCQRRVRAAPCFVIQQNISHFCCFTLKKKNPQMVKDRAALSWGDTIYLSPLFLPTVIVCRCDRATTASSYTKNCRWQAAHLQLPAIFTLPCCRVERNRIARCTTSGQGCYFTVHWNNQKLFGCAGNRHASCSIVTFWGSSHLRSVCCIVRPHLLLQWLPNRPALKP